MMQMVLVSNSRQELVTARTSPFAVKSLQEGAIMSFESSYKGQTREELRFASELGWLAAASFAIVILAL
jgi:c-di-GMP-binding flagellar brake protein YcgR